MARAIRKVWQFGDAEFVDDHPPNNAFEKRFFEDRRIAVHQATRTEDALRLLAMYDYTVLISDMGRGDDRLAGVKLTEQLRRAGNPVPVVIYTIRPDREDQHRSQRELVERAGAQRLRVTPHEVRAGILCRFGNPPRRTAE